MSDFSHGVYLFSQHSKSVTVTLAKIGGFTHDVYLLFENERLGSQRVSVLSALVAVFPNPHANSRENENDPGGGAAGRFCIKYPPPHRL
eukprot:2858119-Rhodomonas_salina.1